MPLLHGSGKLKLELMPKLHHRHTTKALTCVCTLHACNASGTGEAAAAPVSEAPRGLGEGGGDMRGAAASLDPSGWEGSVVIWRYSSVLAVWMSSLAPLPNASSSPASFLTRLTRMGVKALPSRSSRPCRLAPHPGAAAEEGMPRRM